MLTLFISELRLGAKLPKFLVVLLCGLSLAGGSAWAQQPADRAKPDNMPIYNPGSSPEHRRLSGSYGQHVYQYVEKMPVYLNGGNAALTRFIIANTHYPATATQTGKVFVEFIVNKKGEVANPNVTRGLEPVLDAEAIRVIRSLGKFFPGQQNQQPVDVSFTVPVNFLAKARETPKR